MKVWTNTSFTGHYPVGVSAVVVAHTPESAAAFLNDELVKRGLPPSAEPEQFERLMTTSAVAVILNDGNY